jgi:hypothetical protein
MVTILWYVNGQEQKFKDVPKVTAFPESLDFPQIKKTAWMGKEKTKACVASTFTRIFF